MATIKDNLYFTYDGISCKDFGLINVNLDSGMFEEQLTASRSINETVIRGSDTPLFHGIEETPLEFEMTIAFEKKYTDKNIDDVILWLFKDLYKELTFEDKPNKVYLCMPVGDPRLFHTGLKEGYINITMRCKSSRIYSPLFTTQTYDLSTNNSSFNITIANEGHQKILPEISIEKIGAGHITIMNGAEIFEIRDLTNMEQIYINCAKEIIESDIIGVYRYDNVVGDFFDMELEIGNNTLSVQGKCKITFRYKYKYKF